MNTVVALLAAVVAVIGVFLIIQQMRSKSYKGDENTLEYKNDLPITPRDQRPKSPMEIAQIPASSESESEDALSRLANIATQGAPKTTSTDNDDDLITVGLSNTFDQESPMLNNYLGKEDSFDQNNDPLIHAETTVTVFITPKNQVTGISGKEILRLAETYGLKYGVMNMFHRYEHEGGVGGLWFSMLGVGRDGIQAFDINAMSGQRFNGLSLFLSLPNPKAVQGFRSMMSIAGMIARDIDANLLDEENYLIDDAYINKLYLEVENYPNA